MRALNTTALAILATAMTTAVAVAQTPPAQPPRPARAAQATPAKRDSQPPRPAARRQGPAAGQFGPAGQGRMGGGMGGGMGVRMGGGPAGNMLRMRQQLELTDDQVKKLEALQETARPQMNQADMLRARADMMDATHGDVNLEKARAALDKMARLRTDQQIAGLKVRQDARNVLTAPQRTKLDAFAANMRRRAGQMIRQRRGQGGRQDGQFGPGRRQGMDGRGMRRPGMGGQGMDGPGMGPGMGGQGMGGQGMGGQGMGQGRGNMMGPGMMGPGQGQGMGGRRGMMQPGGPPQGPPNGPPQGVRPPGGQTPPADTIR